MGAVGTSAKLVAALALAVAVLAVGVALPLLAFGDGAGGDYQGEQGEAYAAFVLWYDADLREWPFPIDLSVARRVERLEISPGPEGRCPPMEGFGVGPAGAGPFPRGDYRAEVVHYGPFFVPTGKNVFFCDGATTVRLLEPSPESRWSGPFGFVLLAWVLLCLLAVPAVPAALLVGGALLWRGGRQRRERLVGLAALAEGAAIVLAVLVLGVLLPILG
jgi:hypothetical protein